MVAQAGSVFTFKRADNLFENFTVPPREVCEHLPCQGNNCSEQSVLNKELLKLLTFNENLIQVSGWKSVHSMISCLVAQVK